MGNVYDIKSVAKLLGVNYKTLWAVLDDMPVGEVGFMVGKRRFFTDDDMEIIRKHREGRKKMKVGV